MKASELIDIYSRRRAGYEEGLLNYPAPLYDAVCSLLEGLVHVNGNEDVLIEHDGGETKFVLSSSGTVLARLPV